MNEWAVGSGVDRVRCYHATTRQFVIPRPRQLRTQQRQRTTATMTVVTTTTKDGDDDGGDHDDDDDNGDDNDELNSVSIMVMLWC